MTGSIIVSLTINSDVHTHQLRLIIMHDRQTREHAHKEFSKDECSAESCFIQDSSGYRYRLMLRVH